MAKTASKPFSLSTSWKKSPFLAALMLLYSHPRYFKFKRKYQQYGWCFQNIFLFLMTMITCRDLFVLLLCYLNVSFCNLLIFLWTFSKRTRMIFSLKQESLLGPIEITSQHTWLFIIGVYKTLCTRTSSYFLQVLLFRYSRWK